MGRHPIKPSIKKLIFEKALKDKHTPREALAVELKKLIEEMYETPPSHETMIKLISKARNKPESPLDKPWSTATLDKYPIPAEALPTILKLWVWIAENVGDKFTIREALWASRLYTVIGNIVELQCEVRLRALSEIMSEITGISPDRQMDDLHLFINMTGEKMTFDRKRKILEPSMPQTTDEQWKHYEQMEDYYDRLGNGEELDEVFHWGKIDTDLPPLCKVIEEAIQRRNYNERLNKTKE
jgi:hypothetical protein